MVPVIPDPILITGPPRSGTSLVAGIINLCGAWGGEMLGPHPENPRGIFENKAIKEQVFEKYLFRKPGSREALLNRRKLPAYRVNRCIHNLRNNILKVIRNQGYESGPWFYKNPMISLVWQAWHRAFPRAKWVFVCRDLDDNARSCMNTSWMRGLASHSEWRKYCWEYHRRMELMKAEVDWFEFWPQSLFEGKYEAAREMVELLSLQCQPEKLKEFIIPGAWG